MLMLMLYYGNTINSYIQQYINSNEEAELQATSQQGALTQ